MFIKIDYIIYYIINFYIVMNNDFIYGLCGGFVGTLLSHPIDTVKTRIQTQKYDTIINAIKGGKLYSGLTPPLLGIMLEKSIVFGFYDQSKKYGFNNFWSGVIGGFASTVIVTPIDRLKIHFQNNEKAKINTLYKGFLPTIFRETPGFGIYFTTYNYLNSQYNKNNSLIRTFLYGSLSGLSAWIFIYPSDLIKSQYQAHNSPKLSTVIKNIWSKNNNNNNLRIGFLNYYNGFNLAIMRALPLHGGVFLGYELSKNLI
jgi:solute carrier family 25 carnitine/acylcarnitine transporter 20/29